MCSIKAIALFAIIALAFQPSLARCPGCVETEDPNNAEVRESLKQVLLTQNSDDKITKIISVTKQVVAGMKYIVDFETEDQQSNAKRICKSEYVLQPWVSKVPQVLSYSCRQKRSVNHLALELQMCAGCPTKQDPNTFDVSEHLDRILAAQNSDDKIIKVISVTTQVVSGIRYTVEFETENPITKARKICKTEFVSQTWISKMPQISSYKCHSVQKRSVDEYALGLEACAGCPTKHDPKTFDVTEHLENVLATQNSDDKVSRVISVVTKVVNGVEYSVEFETVNPETGVKHICKTEFISRPWVSKVPEVISYKCQGKVQKRSTDDHAYIFELCAGCPTKRDPNTFDVTEHLENVLATQNSDDKVTRVISVTTQVVNGVKYNVEFEAENQETGVKHICKTEFISRPWVSKVPEVVSYKCQKALAKRSLADGPCLGCEMEEDPHKLNLVPKLKQVLATQNSDDEITRVISITSQVVAGIKYKVKFETFNPSNNVKRVCSAVFVDAPWVSKVPQVLSYHCANRRTNSIIEAVQQSEREKQFVDEAAAAAVDRVNMMSNSIYIAKLVKIVNSKIQFLPPLGWRISLDFDVADTYCTKHPKKQTKDCDVISKTPNNVVCHAKLFRHFAVHQWTGVGSVFCDPPKTL